MTTSERVILIQKLAGELCRERPEVAHLTLGEFGFPSNREWLEREPEACFVHMLRGGQDEPLHKLAAHLNLARSSLPTDPEADRRLWAAGFCRCFLSHTSNRKKRAASLKGQLEDYGCDVFVAHEDIEPTVVWLDEIQAALASCHCLIAWVTDDFHDSLWTDQEVGFVLGRGLPVVPIRAGNDPYGLMGKLQAVPFKKAASSNVAEAIFTALNGKNETAQFVASGAVQAFLDSGSFAEAKRRMAIVERLTAITPALRQRLSEAAATNNQIADSFGVPASLNRLLRRPDKFDGAPPRARDAGE